MELIENFRSIIITSNNHHNILHLLSEEPISITILGNASTVTNLSSNVTSTFDCDYNSPNRTSERLSKYNNHFKNMKP